jgi:Domain of unknown function (DUF6542)
MDHSWHAQGLYKVFTGLSAHSRYGLDVSAQRARSAVEASHRSIHPNIPGVPWWAALLIATTATAIGYAIDAGSGHKELTHVFAGFYIAGCLAAVLAVRQEAVFTAIIQPPLILFCAVPGSYWLFHGRKIGNLKDLLINCGYPLIERFPLMLGTAGGVLLIGLFRWYFGMSHRTAAAAGAAEDAEAATSAESHSFIGAIAAKLNSHFGFASREDDADEAPSTDSKRARAASASPKAASRAGRAARGSASAAGPRRAHSRHARPPLEDQHEPAVERSRRPSRRGQAPPRDFDPADPPRRSRRRPRPQGDPDLRGEPPRDVRRDPRHAHRNPYERPAPRGSRFDGYDMYKDMYEPPRAPERNRYEPYEPYEPPYEPERRRATASGNGANPTHHPISRVRYRGSAPQEDPKAEPNGEPRAERRSRSRMPGRSRGRSPAESREYDV